MESAHERIAAAIAARDKATPGPWHMIKQGGIKISPTRVMPVFFAICRDELAPDGDISEICEVGGDHKSEYDATLIAASPNLVDEVIRLREWQQEALKWLEREAKEYTILPPPELDRLIAEARGE